MTPVRTSTLDLPDSPRAWTVTVAEPFAGDEFASQCRSAAVEALRTAWDHLPAQARTAIGWLFETFDRSPQLVVTSAQPGNANSAAWVHGLEIVGFDPFAVEMLPDDLLAGCALHELGHLYIAACRMKLEETGFMRLDDNLSHNFTLCGQDEESAVHVLTECWGLPDSAFGQWCHANRARLKWDWHGDAACLPLYTPDLKTRLVDLLREALTPDLGSAVDTMLALVAADAARISTRDRDASTEAAA